MQLQNEEFINNREKSYDDVPNRSDTWPFRESGSLFRSLSLWISVSMDVYWTRARTDQTVCVCLPLKCWFSWCFIMKQHKLWKSLVLIFSFEDDDENTELSTCRFQFQNGILFCSQYWLKFWRCFFFILSFSLFNRLYLFFQFHN